MKKILLLLLAFINISVAISQVKISAMPTATGNGVGVWIPVLQGGVNKKMLLDSVAKIKDVYVRNDSIFINKNNVEVFLYKNNSAEGIDSVTVAAGFVVDTLKQWNSGTATTAGYIDKSYQLASGGIVTWSGSGLTYNISPAVYYIDQVRYTSASQTVTLTAADPTNPRIDVFALDNTGTFLAIPGTPAATPVEPQIDPATQFYRAFAQINANDTIPTGVTIETIYDENTGAPEWTGTTTGMTANFANTTAPSHLTKHVSTASWASTNTMVFTRSASTTANSFSTLTFRIRLLGTVAGNANISMQFLNGASVISSSVVLGSTHGFSKSVVGAYQAVTVQMSAFSLSSFSADKLRFTFSGTNSTGFYIDYIQWQGGVVNAGGTGTVAAGLANRLAYYNAAGTTISPLAAIIANRALVSDGNGLPTHSVVSATELGYLNGATSNIQTQINSISGGGTTSYQTQTASGSTAFTFTSVPASYNDYIIFRNGSSIRPTTDYTTSGNIITILTIEVGDIVRFQRIK